MIRSSAQLICDMPWNCNMIEVGHIGLIGDTCNPLSEIVGNLETIDQPSNTCNKLWIVASDLHVFLQLRVNLSQCICKMFQWVANYLTSWSSWLPYPTTCRNSKASGCYPRLSIYPSMCAYNIRFTLNKYGFVWSHCKAIFKIRVQLGYPLRQVSCAERTL